jgi:hypothetical protein
MLIYIHVLSYIFYFDVNSFQAEEEEDQYKIAGGVTTTAEPRPNAYIPILFYILVTVTVGSSIMSKTHTVK